MSQNFRKKSGRSRRKHCSPREKKIIEALGNEPVGVKNIELITRIERVKIAGALMALEVKGVC